MSDFDEYKIYGNKAIGGTRAVAIKDAETALPKDTPYLLVEGDGFWAWIYTKDLKSCLNGSVALKACKA